MLHRAGFFYSTNDQKIPIRLKPQPPNNTFPFPAQHKINTRENNIVEHKRYPTRNNGYLSGFYPCFYAKNADSLLTNSCSYPASHFPQKEKIVLHF